MKKIITTEQAPAAIGPYSQAVSDGDMLFISGQLPVNPETGKIAGDNITLQTEQSLKNLTAILTEAGMKASHVLKTTVYLSDMENFKAMNEVYASVFTEGFPARAAFQVARLPLDVLVEIEAVASVKAGE
jgi:2-iminobutanoate/2-iminopropanoate deaminase